MQDKPPAIPMANYLAFMNLVNLAGGGQDAAELVASLLAAGPAEEELERLTRLVSLVAERADKRGFERASKAAPAPAAKEPVKASRWTPEEAELIKTWRSSRGAVMPDVIKEYIGWRIVEKGEAKTAMMKRFTTAIETVNKAILYYQQKHGLPTREKGPVPEGFKKPVAAGRPEPVVSRSLEPAREPAGPLGGPINREGQDAVTRAPAPAAAAGPHMPGYFVRDVTPGREG